jgi:glycosyl transferase, family 25
MRVYIINMDSATDRWSFVQSHFSKTGLPVIRVSGVVGKNIQLPIPEYDETRLRRWHGQTTNMGAIGCYLSHINCMRAFLATDDETAMIAEDDGRPVPELRSIVDASLKYQDCWDILRLCGFHDPHPVEYANLGGEYRLATCFTRLCGTGAYVLTRHAAQVLLKKLMPMCLPIDHALDREWVYGLRASAVMPLPISQVDHGFGSQIAGRVNHKLPWYQRYWTVFPYRFQNEFNRLVQRRKQLVSARELVRQIDRRTSKVGDSRIAA